jgi:hypothetical protein
VVTVLLATVATVHAQADDDDDDDDDASSSAPSGPPVLHSVVFAKDDSPTCAYFETGRKIDRSHASRREIGLELLEAVAHANDPILARRAYDALYLMDEKGTPSEDFNKASDIHRDWAASHPEQVKWLADPAHAKQFAELQLADDWGGDDRLLQAASSAGDPLLLEKLHPLISDGELARFHDGWVQRHPDFVASVTDPAKAKQFVDQTLVILRGSDDEHRAVYAAHHGATPSLEARVRTALLLDGSRASVFDPAQDEWEKAHAKELAALEGAAAAPFIAAHLGVGPAPAAGSDDDHALYAAAVASGDDALLAQTKRQLAIIDFGGQTDQGDAFLAAHLDWQAAHPTVPDKASATAYARGHVKASPWGFPEDNLKLYVAAKHAPEHFQAQSNVMKGLKLTQKCDIHKFMGEANLYEVEHPEFVATVSKPDAAAAYFNGHLSASAYTDPGTLAGLSIEVLAGLGIPLSKGNDVTGAISSAVPFELTAGYRYSPTSYFGAFASYSFVSTSCDPMATVDCGLFTLRVGGEFGHNFAPFNKYEPWIHFGAGWAHLWASELLIQRDGVELHARGTATLLRSGSAHVDAFASIQLSAFDQSLMMFVFGIGGGFAP